MEGSAAAEPVPWGGTSRYEVLSCLGQGGMGVVYEAFDCERRLGQMLGGSEGRAMSDAAIADVIARGGTNPERWLQLQLPGKWSADA